MLDHIRVLDLTDGGAAIAGQILAQLGAEVILVEPNDGVASRRVGPFADDRPGTERNGVWSSGPTIAASVRWRSILQVRTAARSS